PHRAVAVGPALGPPHAPPQTQHAAGAGRADRVREAAALFECALEDPEVMRARARVRHLAEPPGRAYADPAVRARVARWLADRPGWVPHAVGPDRSAWEELTASASVPPQPALPSTSARS
ncbi:hypothetical protein WDV06_14690, partial [Streptomyces racemochromogenes]